MLSSVLPSERGATVNIEIMRAFVPLREILGSHVDLARRLATTGRPKENDHPPTERQYGPPGIWALRWRQDV